MVSSSIHTLNSFIIKYFYYLDSSKSSKHGKPMSFVIPPIANLTYDVENVAVKVIEILNSINVKYKTVQKKDVIRTMEIKASKNTWSHQRRKRRLEKSQQRVSSVITKSESIQSDDNHETLDCEPSQKKAKISVDDNGIDSEVNSSSPQTSISSPPPSSSIVEDFITAAVCIRKYDDSVMLEIGYVSGTGGKDSVHQIIQYIKNNWK